MKIYTLTLIRLTVMTTVAHAQTTISPTAPYAYAANAGWLNFRPGAADGVRVAEFSLSGKVYAANFGWVNLGNGTNNQYGNATAVDFGVNHDGAGNLFGYAWGANIGWIKFGDVGSSAPTRARFSVQTGQFSGYVYSANLGWISLDTGLLKTDQVIRTDSDGDGIGDAWEYAYSGNLTTLGRTSDYDHDGRTDLQEYLADTNPLAKDAAPTLDIFALPDSAGLHVSHLRYDGRATRSYELFRSPTMTAGTWTSLGQQTGVNGYTDLYRLSPEPRLFYRLSVQPPVIP
jgi:hypothetical protein